MLIHQGFLKQTPVEVCHATPASPGFHCATGLRLQRPAFGAAGFSAALRGDFAPWLGRHGGGVAVRRPFPAAGTTGDTLSAAW